MLKLVSRFCLVNAQKEVVHRMVADCSNLASTNLHRYSWCSLILILAMLEGIECENSGQINWQKTNQNLSAYFVTIVYLKIFLKIYVRRASHGHRSFTSNTATCFRNGYSVVMSVTLWTPTCCSKSLTVISLPTSTLLVLENCLFNRAA